MGRDIEGKNPDDYAGSFHGVSLSDNGKILAVGAYGNDDNGKDNGSVTMYAFDGIGMPWSQVGDVIYGENEYDQAAYVSLSGDGLTIAIGGPYNSNGGQNSGHVRIFKYLVE